MPFKIEFILTDEELDIIEHAVVSESSQEPGERVGHAWARRVLFTLGPQPMYDKVAKYREAYLQAKANAEVSGVPYKNAAEREAEAQAERQKLKS